MEKREMMRWRRILILSGLALAAVTSSLARSNGWKTGENKPAAQAEVAGGDVSKGRGVYRAHCAICHFSASTTKKIGPGMKGLYARGRFTDGTKVNDTSLHRWIERGGKNMPGFKNSLRARQIRDLMAYLKTL